MKRRLLGQNDAFWGQLMNFGVKRSNLGVSELGEPVGQMQFGVK